MSKDDFVKTFVFPIDSERLLKVMLTNKTMGEHTLGISITLEDTKKNEQILNWAEVPEAIQDMNRTIQKKLEEAGFSKDTTEKRIESKSGILQYGAYNYAKVAAFLQDMQTTATDILLSMGFTESKVAKLAQKPTNLERLQSILSKEIAPERLPKVMETIRESFPELTRQR